MSEKLRLDVAVFERGYAETREKAKAMIMAGSVYLNGQKALKGGVTIKETDVIEVRGAVNPFVSRGGQIERDIHIWHDLKPGITQEQLDKDAHDAKRGTKGKGEQNAGSFDTDDFFDAAMRKSLGDNYDKIMKEE